MMENVSTRKPHSGNAGYVCERKARLGGHIVVYDRESGCGVDADVRWIVMQEPSSRHIAVKTERQARDVMKGLAEARTLEEASAIADGIFAAPELDPTDDNPVKDWDEAPGGRRGKVDAGDDLARRRAALERFMADPENEPSAEGKAALDEAFRRRS